MNEKGQYHSFHYINCETQGSKHLPDVIVRVLVKWGDRAQDPSALELLDLKECNWTYRSYSRPLNAQTFFRQTGKFFSVILPKNDNSSIPVN